LLLFRVSPTRPRRIASPQSAPPLRFLPLQRSRYRESALPEVSKPRHVSASGFRTLLPICSSRHRSGLFHPDGTLGVFALQGFFLTRSRATSSMCALPSWHFLRTVMVAMALPTVGASTRAASFRVEAFSCLQGFQLPASSYVSVSAFTHYRPPFPSWALASLRFSPRSSMRRISPPLHFRALPSQASRGVPGVLNPPAP